MQKKKMWFPFPSRVCSFFLSYCVPATSFTLTNIVQVNKMREFFTCLIQSSSTAPRAPFPHEGAKSTDPSFFMLHTRYFAHRLLQNNPYLKRFEKEKVSLICKPKFFSVHT